MEVQGATPAARPCKAWMTFLDLCDGCEEAEIAISVLERRKPGFSGDSCGPGSRSPRWHVPGQPRVALGAGDTGSDRARWAGLGVQSELVQGLVWSGLNGVQSARPWGAWGSSRGRCCRYGARAGTSSQLTHLPVPARSPTYP